MKKLRSVGVSWLVDWGFLFVLVFVGFLFWFFLGGGFFWLDGWLVFWGVFLLLLLFWGVLFLGWGNTVWERDMKSSFRTVTSQPLLLFLYQY